jgi:hypothetical protein
VAKSNIIPQKSSDFSRALEILSSADKSIEPYERRKRISLPVTSIALLLHIGRSFFVPIICPGVENGTTTWCCPRYPSHVSRRYNQRDFSFHFELTSGSIICPATLRVWGYPAITKEGKGNGHY